MYVHYFLKVSFGRIVFRAGYTTLNEDNLFASHAYPVTLNVRNEETKAIILYRAGISSKHLCMMQKNRATIIFLFHNTIVPCSNNSPHTV